MLALIACHDDAEVLRGSLPRIREALRPGEDRLVVVADRCGDESATVATEQGAVVIERHDESSGVGKGGALLRRICAIWWDAETRETRPRAASLTPVGTRALHNGGTRNT
jgi:hypothetical protein